MKCSYECLTKHTMVQINNTQKVCGITYESHGPKQTISGAVDNIILEADWSSSGLGPSQWRTVNQISCNSTFDRCVSTSVSCNYSNKVEFSVMGEFLSRPVEILWNNMCTIPRIKIFIPAANAMDK